LKKEDDDMNTMTPSMTPNQVNKLVEQFRAHATKHAAEFGSDAAQTALGTKGLVAEMFAPFRKRAELVSNMIVRHATVDPSLTGKQAIDATGHVQYLNDTVIDEMPHGNVADVDVHFFKLGRSVSCTDLLEEYELRDLSPADPFSLAAVNQADPAFADDHPNGTQWTDSAGKFCYAIFSHWGDERSVNVFQNDNDWFVNWWFAGVRKSTQV
jgi:hypothetical protein